MEMIIQNETGNFTLHVRISDSKEYDFLKDVTELARKYDFENDDFEIEDPEKETDQVPETTISEAAEEYKGFLHERLRKCRLCRVKGRKAIFHRWTEIATVVEPSLLVGGSPGGKTNITLAIVEYKNGKVEQVYPGEIKFLDTQVNWPEQEK